MISQNCRAEVDSDLVFGTDCGARLHETISTTPTLLMKDSVVTQVSAPPPKSNLKWIALIVALLAIRAPILGVFLRLNRQSQTPKNVNKPITPAPPRKGNVNQTNNATANSNANTVDTNLDGNKPDSNVVSNSMLSNTKIIWKEQIKMCWTPIMRSF